MGGGNEGGGDGGGKGDGGIDGGDGGKGGGDGGGLGGGGDGGGEGGGGEGAANCCITKVTVLMCTSPRDVERKEPGFEEVELFGILTASLGGTNNCAVGSLAFPIPSKLEYTTRARGTL